MTRRDLAWLSDTPRGWSLSQVRHVCTVETGSRDTVEAVEDAEYPFFVRSPKAERIDTYSYDTEAVLTAGDGDVGKVFHHYIGKFEAHQRVYVFHRFRGITGRFFYYWFSNQFHHVTEQGTAESTVASLRRPMIVDFPVLLPPLEEQRAIAEFLDWETAQIDAMIDAQQRLVELLVERRAALADRLAIAGLTNTDETSRARSATSGQHLAVEAAWASLPNSWRVTRFKAALARSEERNIGGEHTMMSLKSNGSIVPRSTLGERQEPDPDNIPRYLVVRPGQLVVNPMWLTGGAIGVSNVVGAVSPDYRVFRSRGEHEPRYLHHLLRTRPYLDQYLLFTRAQTTFDRRVQQDDLDNLPLPVPTLEEQREIARQIDAHAAGIDRLILQAERSVDLMRERRVALITASVTGRIDPRTGVERLDGILEGVAS